MNKRYFLVPYVEQRNVCKCHTTIVDMFELVLGLKGVNGYHNIVRVIEFKGVTFMNICAVILGYVVFDVSHVH